MHGKPHELGTKLHELRTRGYDPVSILFYGPNSEEPRHWSNVDLAIQMKRPNARMFSFDSYRGYFKDGALDNIHGTPWDIISGNHRETGLSDIAGRVLEAEFCILAKEIIQGKVIMNYQETPESTEYDLLIFSYEDIISAMHHAFQHKDGFLVFSLV
ncbi:MAG: hypothetical protein HGA85_00880 [Nanoarchaeota archaeon]|nr:hypothetical protein [Nanoarchaeota archaeon]